MKRLAPLLTAWPLAVVLIFGPLLSAHATEMKDRVCPRVVTRFASDPVMWQRVNDRVEKRFGFRCSQESSSSTSSAARKSQSSKATPAKQPVYACVQRDWQCSDWSPCNGGKQKRTCQLANFACYSPENGKPRESQECTDTESEEEVRLRVKISFDTWKAFHDQIIARAEVYLKQPAGRAGLVELGSIETRFLVQYNAYVKEYNGASYVLADNVGSLDLIEEEMIEIKKEFDALPLIYY